MYEGITMVYHTNLTGRMIVLELPYCKIDIGGGGLQVSPLA